MVRLRNLFKIDGDITTIFLQNKNRNINLETIVDTHVYYETLKDIDVTWFSHWDIKMQKYYARATKYQNISGEYKYTTLFLHRVIMGASVGERVDHDDHDTLNNLKHNLKVTTTEYNSKNRKSRNKNNKTGYRNVSYIKGKYVVQLQVNGKNTRLGEFSDVDEAGKFAEVMRQKYYGEYAGNN